MKKIAFVLSLLCCNALAMELERIELPDTPMSWGTENLRGILQSCTEYAPAQKTLQYMIWPLAGGSISSMGTYIWYWSAPEIITPILPTLVSYQLGAFALASTVAAMAGTIQDYREQRNRLEIAIADEV